MTNTNGNADRRSFLKLVSAGGVAAVTSLPVSTGTVAADTSELPIEPREDARKGDVDVPHPTEYAGVLDRAVAAAREDDPTLKYGPRLPDEMDRDDPGSTLHVRTVGDLVRIETERYGKEVDGLKPADEELDALAEYGEIGFAPAFSSTTVSLRNVARDDLEDVAALPHVLTVEYRNETYESGSYDVNQCPDSETYVDPDRIRSDEMCGFEAVADADTVGTNNPVKIGVVDMGYNLEESDVWPENYAAPYIDETLADDFSETWNRTDGDYQTVHGNWVTNTLAYMLGDGWDEMIVPLENKHNVDHAEPEDAVRAAIEFATRHDIDVLNMSLGYSNTVTQSHCTATFCDDFVAYVAAGNVPVAAAGNDDVFRLVPDVDEPGASRFDISVGGVDGEKCDGEGFSRSLTNSSDPATYDDGTLCPVCHDTGVEEQFLPDVYGVFAIEGEGFDGRLCGSSFATPQFAAAVALLKEHGLEDHWEAKAIARAQDATPVCPDDSAQAGQLFSVPDMLEEMTPTAPADVDAAWVADVAAEVTWEPASLPETTDTDVDFYEMVVSKPLERVHVDTLEIDPQGDATHSYVLGNLDPGSDYSIGLSAYDERGRQSGWDTTRFVTADAG